MAETLGDCTPSPTPSVAGGGGAQPNDSEVEGLARGEKNEMFVARRNRVAMSRRVESYGDEDSETPDDDDDDIDGQYGFFGTEKEWQLSQGMYKA